MATACIAWPARGAETLEVIAALMPCAYLCELCDALGTRRGWLIWMRERRARDLLVRRAAR